MQRFFYKAKKTSGEIITGEIDAADDASAVIKLQETGVYPVTLEPQESSFSVKKKLKKEVPSFTRQLSDLVSSDIPLVKSLNILSKQTKNKDWQKLLTSVSEKVERGQDFSSSLGAHPDIFDKIYTGIVRAGEESGTLNTSLERLSEYYEKRLEIIGKIKSTLTYPIAVFSVGLLTLAFLVIFVMPRFASMFRDIGRALPLPTKILILLSNTARYGWWVYVPLVVVVYLYLKKYLKTEKGKIAFERFKMSLPVVGDIFLYTIVTRFCLTMGTLIKNGIPLLDSVKYAEESTGSILVKNDTEKIIKTVTDGSGVALGFHGSAIFPQGIVDMVSLGEESGNLDKMLLRAADYYSKEADMTLKRVMSLLEPAIIVALGLMVGFIVISILLPVFDLGGAMR